MVGQKSETEKIGVVSAFVKMFKNYSNFKERSRRKEFWNAALAGCVIAIILGIIFVWGLNREFYDIFIEEETGKARSGGLGVFEISLFAFVGYLLVSIVPMLAITVRRLHDIGKSGKYLFLIFIPGVGAVLLFIFALIDSAPGTNKYGPNPKGIE